MLMLCPSQNKNKSVLYRQRFSRQVKATRPWEPSETEVHSAYGLVGEQRVVLSGACRSRTYALSKDHVALASICAACDGRQGDLFVHG